MKNTEEFIEKNNMELENNNVLTNKIEEEKPEIN